MSRIVCQFSCGAASAVATKLAIAQYGRTLSSALEQIERGAPDAQAIARAALEQANPFGWNERRPASTADAANGAIS